MPPTAQMPDEDAQQAIAAQARSIAAAMAGMEGPLLPILHALHDAFGHLPDAALSPVAETLGLSRAEVHGVASFYHDFRTAPAGRHVLKLCRAEACQATGGTQLAEALHAALGIGWGQTTPDGRVTLEPVYCLGLCACGPAALLDGAPIGRATPARLLEAVA